MYVKLHCLNKALHCINSFSSWGRIMSTFLIRCSCMHCWKIEFLFLTQRWENEQHKNSLVCVKYFLHWLLVSCGSLCSIRFANLNSTSCRCVIWSHMLIFFSISIKWLSIFIRPWAVVFRHCGRCKLIICLNSSTGKIRRSGYNRLELSMHVTY